MKHDHSHGHDHHDGECCGHGHSHKEQTCSHGHEHGEECSHGHVHSSKCSHEHEHGEQCAHSHEHEHVHGPHCSHGHDHEHEDAQADAEWTRRFFLVLQAVVLMMIGGVMCFFVASGRINYFLAPTFRALALWGGIGIMVMGLFNLLVNHSKKECCHDHDHDDDDSGHVHSHEGSVAGRAVTLLLLSSSIAAAAILTPDRQTSQYLMYKESAARRNGINSERLKKENPGLASALNEASKGQGLTLERLEKNGLRRNPEGNYVVSVMDLYYMPQDLEYSRVMKGQNVEVTGQLIKDPANPGPGHMKLFVLQITCCAADAQPWSIPILFEGGFPDFVDANWYAISGKIEMVEERGMKTCRINATGLKSVPRPADQRMGF